MGGYKTFAFGIGCLVLLVLSSCRTTRVVTPTADIKPISSSKLLRNIEKNAFDYKYLAIKRITCQFDNGQNKTSFKASILAEKDKRITVMLSKLNIPVGRLWLSPDSVKFINYLEDTYFLDDYGYLSSWLGMDLDFETIHAIISNNIFSLPDFENREFECQVDSGQYVLKSLTKLKSKKSNRRPASQNLSGKPNAVVNDAVVRQSFFVDPQNFKLRRINMEDRENARNLNIVFSDYQEVDKQLYPGEVFLKVNSRESNIELRIKFSGFSTQKEKDIRFKIPESYTRINTN